MAIPTEVRKTIQGIDQKIEVLEETKKRLLEAFGGPLPVAKSNGNRPQNAISAFEAGSNGTMSSGDKLASYLQTHGPATRQEIAEESGVPGGSISYLLKNGRFRHRADDKWEVAA